MPRSTCSPRTEAGSAARVLSTTAVGAFLIRLWWEEQVWVQRVPFGVQRNIQQAVGLEVSEGALTRPQSFASGETGDDHKDF
jgi:hypothetical protein